MPDGTEVGLGPSDIVLDADPAPRKRPHTPIFSPCLLWANGRPSQLHAELLLVKLLVRKQEVYTVSILCVSEHK